MPKLKNISKAGMKSLSAQHMMRLRQNEALAQHKDYIEVSNRNEKNVIVDTLISRVDDEKSREALRKHNTTYIDNLLWQTKNDFYLSNLPKINDYDYNRLNFSFGDSVKTQQENFEKMVSAEKIAVAYYTYHYSTDEHTFNVVKVYSITPSLYSTGLPVIYRSDIITTPNNSNFYGVRCAAVVGGCVDGYCPLFQVVKKDNNTAALFITKSGYTSMDPDLEFMTSNHKFHVEDVKDITNLQDAVDFAFKKFNLEKSLEKGQFSSGKVFDMVNALNQKHRPSLVKINPQEYIDAIMTTQTPTSHGATSGQVVRKDNGRFQNSAKNNREKAFGEKD